MNDKERGWMRQDKRFGAGDSAVLMRNWHVSKRESK